MARSEKSLVHVRAGNQLLALGGGAGYAYDAEMRMKSATDSTLGTTNYSYDGDGRRVTKQLPTGVVMEQKMGSGAHFL